MTSNFIHPAVQGTNTAESVDSAEILVTDSAGNTATVTVYADVVDDIPVLAPSSFGNVAPGSAASAIDLGALFGADGAGSVTFTETSGPVLDTQGNQIFFEGVPLNWSVDGNTLVATTVNGVVPITVEPNLVDGTYTLTLADGIFYVEGGVRDINLGDLTGGNDDQYALQLSGGVGVVIDSEGGTTNTSNALNIGYVGVGGQWVEPGETVTFAFYNLINPPGGAGGGFPDSDIDIVRPDGTIAAGVTAFSFNIDLQAIPQPFSLDITVRSLSGVTGLTSVTISGGGSYSVTQSAITWADGSASLPIATVDFAGTASADYRVGVSEVSQVLPSAEIPISIPVEIRDADGDMADGYISGSIVQGAEVAELTLESRAFEPEPTQSEPMSSSITTAGSNGAILATDGDDVFAFSLRDADDSPDSIVGFGASGNDVLDLRDLLQGEEATGADLTSYLNVSYDGANTVIAVSTDGSFQGNNGDAAKVDRVVTLEGVDLVGGHDDMASVIQSMLDSGKLSIDQ